MLLLKELKDNFYLMRLSVIQQEYLLKINQVILKITQLAIVDSNSFNSYKMIAANSNNNGSDF